MNPDRTPRAFTLIELLISISIVFTLISIGAPALSSARATSQRTMCLSNLHQVGLAVHLYMDGEGRGVMPASPSIYSARPEERARALRGELLLDLLAESLAGPACSDGNGGFARKQPQMCPADRVFAPTWGFSYDYAAGLFMEEPVSMWVTPEMARRTTAFYMDGERIDSRLAASKQPALFTDARAFHRAAPPGTLGINAISFDGSAGWSLAPVLSAY